MSRLRAALVGLGASTLILTTAGLLVQAPGVPGTATKAAAADAATVDMMSDPDPLDPTSTLVVTAPDLPAGSLPALEPAYERVLGLHGDAKVVYLTFDDGPTENTPKVLDILDQAGAKGTFCQVGSHVSAYPAVERRIIADGHTLCNHSWDHPTGLPNQEPEAIADEIGRTQEAFEQFGVTSHYFRAPRGDWGSTPTLRQVAQVHQVRPLGWSVDSEDWKKPGVDAIVNNVVSNVTPGAIILMHDGGGTTREQTLAALPKIINELRAKGYSFAALPADGIG